MTIDYTMKYRVRATIAACLLLASLSLGGCKSQLDANAAPTRTTANVDGAFIAANSAATKEWPSYGLDYSESRFSKLKQITTENVGNLGLAWSYDLGSKRGVEATPLVVDGIMYVTSSWSVVHAIDVRTGKAVWTYDPQVPRRDGIKGCCDVVNRGVALYGGMVYVGAFDGRICQ